MLQFIFYLNLARSSFIYQLLSPFEECRGFRRLNYARMPSPKTDLPVLPFKDQKAWAAWLARNHAESPGIWLQLAKKDSDVPSVTYPEALEAALCYGWIDGQKQGYDESFWLQKFTPRGPCGLSPVPRQRMRLHSARWSTRRQ